MKAKCPNCGKLIKSRLPCQICGKDGCGFCLAGSPLGGVHAGECLDTAFDAAAYKPEPAQVHLLEAEDQDPSANCEDEDEFHPRKANR